MSKIYFIIGYIVIAFIVYTVLVYIELGVRNNREVYNKGDADSPLNAIAAALWPFVGVMAAAVLPFWACYKLAFKLKEKFNPEEINPNSLNKNKSC